MIPYITNWIKDNGRKLMYTLGVVLLLLIGYFVCKKILNVPSTAVTALDNLVPVTYSKDTNGNLLAVIRAHEIKLLENEVLIDSLAAALKVKPKMLKGYDRYVIHTDTVVKTDVRFVVTEDSVTLYKKDPYLELKVVGKDSTLSYFNLKHTDTLFRTQITHTPLLKAPYTEIILRNASPYNTITCGSSLKIRSPRPFLTAGPYIGYDPFLKKPSVGISIQLSIIRLYK